MRVDVDRNRCEGHAMCEAIAPTVFSVDDDGDLLILQEEIAEGDAADVKSAALGCPVAALKLI
ncbi:ferredoxin [Mycolicibacterium farcinogenes]|uniref:ferredoxin n=1 Tax=Mycolicibacterium farcinogenes TaxID=1802 RepID=UPI001C8E20AB|nr:ferredoxin [Mycolicibacterium farcinogenes]QZH61239.1 ferredoxin [Mycolicibacterium farcinogenes]